MRLVAIRMGRTEDELAPESAYPELVALTDQPKHHRHNQVNRDCSQTELWTEAGSSGIKRPLSAPQKQGASGNSHYCNLKLPFIW